MWTCNSPLGVDLELTHSYSIKSPFPPQFAIFDMDIELTHSSFFGWNNGRMGNPTGSVTIFNLNTVRTKTIIIKDPKSVTASELLTKLIPLEIPRRNRNQRSYLQEVLQLWRSLGIKTCDCICNLQRINLQWQKRCLSSFYWQGYFRIYLLFDLFQELPRHLRLSYFWATLFVFGVLWLTGPLHGWSWIFKPLAARGA